MSVRTNREKERAELHKTIWKIANDLRGSVDGWDFKNYVRACVHQVLYGSDILELAARGIQFAGIHVRHRSGMDHHIGMGLIESPMHGGLIRAIER